MKEKKQKATSTYKKIKRDDKILAEAERLRAISKKVTCEKRGVKDERASKTSAKPLYLTQDLIKQISSLILAGAYVETACAAVGISKVIYYEWLKLGNKRKNCSPEDRKHIDILYEQFTDAINKAVVQAELRDIVRIDKAAETTWAAAAWKLERKHPERWGRKVRIDGEVNQNIKQDVKISIEEKRLNVIKILKNTEALDAAFKVLEAISSAKEKEAKANETKAIESTPKKET